MRSQTQRLEWWDPEPRNKGHRDTPIMTSSWEGQGKILPCNLQRECGPGTP